MRDVANQGHRLLNTQPPNLFLEHRSHGSVADEEQVTGGILSQQPREGIDQEIHSVPGLEAAHETDHKPALKVQLTAKRNVLRFCPKQACIDRVGQNLGVPGLYSGFLEMGQKGLRNPDQQISSAPDPALSPSCQRRKARPSPILLILVGKRRVYL